MVHFRDLSVYRKELMGVAIVFIMATHSIGRFAPYGNIGVEWFLILSGIGLFYSLKKDDVLKNFYKKRFMRIIPIYLVVSIPFFLIKYPFSIRDLLIRISGLNIYFFWERTFWFIPMLVICYAIAPFYFKLVCNKRWSIIIPFILTSLIFVLSFHMPRTQIMVTRFPIFLLGMHVGKAVYEDKSIEIGRNPIWTWLISLVAMAAIVLFNYLPHRVEVARQLYFWCSIPALFFILSIVKMLKDISLFRNLLCLLGTVSLEIYMVHESIVFASCLLLPVPKIIAALLSYVLSVMAAYYLHKFIPDIFTRKRS